MVNVKFKSFYVLPILVVAITCAVVFSFLGKQASAEVLEVQEQEQLEVLEEQILEENSEESQIEKVDIELTIGKYVDLDDKEDVTLLQEITDNTPLDFETAYILVTYARGFDVQPSLILAMIELESNFDQYCSGAADDRGYLQVIPGTEKWLIELFGEELGFEYNPERIFDADYNIGLGVAYISLLKNAYGDDYNRMLSEYNRGPYNLKKYFEKNDTYETAYSRSILSREKKYTAYN